MLKKLIAVVYLLLLCLVAVVALTVGVTNSGVTDFNVLFVKTRMSVGSVSALSLLFGFLAGLLACAYALAKLWFRLMLARREIRKLRGAPAAAPGGADAAPGDGGDPYRLEAGAP